MKKFSKSCLFCLAVINLPSNLPAQEVARPRVVNENEIPQNAAGMVDQEESEFYQLAINLYAEAIKQQDPQLAKDLLLRTEQRLVDFVNRYKQANNTPMALYHLADVYKRLDNQRGMLDTYAELVQRFPRHAYASYGAYYLGLSAMAQEDWQDAVRRLDFVLRENAVPELVNDVTYRLGYSYLRMNRKGDAYRCFDKLARNEQLLKDNAPLALLALTMTANMDQQEKRFDLAVERLQKALAITQKSGAAADKKQAAALKSTLASLYQKLNKPKQALELYGELAVDGSDAQMAASARMQAAALYFNDKQYQKVVDLLGAQKIDSDNAEVDLSVLSMLAKAYAKLGKEKQAQEIYEKITIKQPVGSEGHFAASYAVQQLKLKNKDKDFLAANARFLDQYNNRRADSSLVQEAWLQRALRLEQEKRDNDAMAAWNMVRAERLSNEHRPLVYLRRAALLSRLGDRAKAIKDFEAFLDLPHDNNDKTTQNLVAGALLGRAQAYQAQGQLERAMQDFEQVTLRFGELPVAQDAWMKCADLLSQLNRQNDAEKKYSEYIKKFPKGRPQLLARAHHMVGKSLYDNSKYAEAIKHLEESIVLHPERFYESGAKHLVLCYIKANDFANARKTFDELEQRFPNSVRELPPAIASSIGLDCFNNKNFADANKYLSKVADEKNPLATKKELWRKLATARMLVADHQAALKALNFFIAAEENNTRKIEALVDRAHMQRKLKQNQQAMDSIKEALRFDLQGPAQAKVYMERGEIYAAMNDLDKAADDFNRTAQLFTDDKQLRPLALSRCVEVLRQAGKNSDADQFAADLKKEFPDWKKE